MQDQVDVGGGHAVYGLAVGAEPGRQDSTVVVGPVKPENWHLQHFLIRFFPDICGYLLSYDVGEEIPDEDEDNCGDGK